MSLEALRALLSDDYDPLEELRRRREEDRFRKWYGERAGRLGLNPDPDASEHFYDYRAAFRAGAEPDASGHWPSEFKLEGHPRMMVNGVNTKTGFPGNLLPIPGGLPTEEMPELREADLGTVGKRVGKDILSGTAALAAGSTRLFEGPLGYLPGSPSSRLYDLAEDFQESAGWGHPGGPEREALIEGSLAAGRSPVEAALGETAAAVAGMADPTDFLMPVAGAMTAGRRPLAAAGKRLLRGAAETAGPAAPAARAASAATEAVATTAPAARRSTEALSESLATVEDVSEAIKVVQRRMALGVMSEAEGAQELAKIDRIVKRMEMQRELAEPSLKISQDIPPAEDVSEPIGGVLRRRATDDEIEQALRSQEVSLGEPRQTVGEPLRPPLTPQQYNVHKLPISKEGKDEIARLLNDEAQRIAKSSSGVTITWKETVAAAEGMARRTNRSIDEIIERFASKNRKGQILADPELVLTHSLMGSTETAIRETAQALTRATDPTEIERLTLRANAFAERYVGLLELSAGSGSKAGRSLNLHRMLIDSLDAPALQRRSLLRKYKERLTPEAIGYLSRMDPEDLVAHREFLSHLKADKFGEYAFTYWISSILSGLGTFGRNLTGLASTVGMEQPVRALRAGPDAILAKLGGRPREYYLQEAAILNGPETYFTAWGRGFQKAVKIFAHGAALDETGKLAPPRNPWLYLRTGRPKADKALKALGVAIDIPFRGLSAPDAAVRTMTTMPEIVRLARRQALKDGLKPGTEEFAGRVDFLMRDDDILQQAAEHGQRMTLTDQVTTFTKHFQRLPGIRWLSPFARIADRITYHGTKFTPLSAVTHIPASIRRGMKGGQTFREAATSPEIADLTTRLAIGSSMSLGLLSWAKGEDDPDFPRLVAWMPQDPQEREAAYARGLKPWSMRIGDSYVQFQQAEPLSFPLAAAAVILHQMREGEDRLPDYRATEFALGIGRFVLDKTYMQGLSQLMEAIENEGRGGGKAAFRQAVRMAQSLQWPSAFTRDLTRLMGDDAVREPDSILQALFANVPKLSERVPARLDALGQEVERTPGGSFPERLRGLFGGTPFSFSRIPEVYTHDELPRWDRLDDDERLGVVRVELDKAGIHPSLMERRLCVDGKDTVLDRAQFREYQQRAGEEQAQAVATVLGYDRYRRMKPDDRAAWLKEEINAARRRARQAQFGYEVKVGKCRR